jgi:hypothetical protein
MQVNWTGNQEIIIIVNYYKAYIECEESFECFISDQDDDQRKNQVNNT